MYINVYVYIGLHIWIQMSKSTYIPIFRTKPISISMFVHIDTCVSSFTYISISASVTISIYLYLCRYGY